MPRPLLFLCALAGAVGCAAGGGAPSAGFGLAGAREDRVLVGSFSQILGLAVSQRYVFAAGPAGVAVRDRQFRRWLPPLAIELMGAVPRPVVMAADPTEDAVWIGTDGAVIFYRPLFGDARRTYVPGTVDMIMFDRNDPSDGALVRSSGGWTRVSSAGFALSITADQLPRPEARIIPPTPEDIFRAYPSLRAFGGLITRDASLQSYPVTAAAAAPDRGEVYLGTLGNGIFEVDPVFNREAQLAYGLLVRSAEALALASDGVWVAGSGESFSSSASGLTFASTDLEEWRWLTDPMLAGRDWQRSYDLAVRDGAAWIGTDRGLVRMETRSAGLRRWSALHGLPDDRVTALSLRSDGAWVGTARGLVFLAWPGGVVGPALLPATTVRALAAIGDTLWAGTDGGLLLLDGSRPPVIAEDASGPQTMAPRVVGDTRLARPIVALAAADSELFAATEGEVVALAGGHPRPSRFAAVDFRPVAPITALAADARTLWVAGRRGVLVVDRASMVTRLLRVGSDLPDEAWDVVLAPDVAWLGTRAGLLRVRRLDDGLPR